jgi:catechol 2,3-dioxygenase-like lactoylglutathione lyase family enzyme
MAKKSGRAKRARAGSIGAGVRFNHVMLYVSDLDQARAFYGGRLGLREIAHAPPYYARLRSPRGATTIALHALEPGRTAAADGVRLYFEIENLAAFCRRLAADGVAFTQMPAKQPWGWTHAYLDDPDGREISLYWAGAQRLRRELPPPRATRR